jgi:hypothetical protein
MLAKDRLQLTSIGARGRTDGRNGAPAADDDERFAVPLNGI